MNAIRIMIIDDHSIVRDGLKYMIGISGDFEVIGEAEGVLDALEILQKIKPDIILLDYKLERSDGVIACREIKKRYPQIKILMLTAFAEEQVVTDAIKSGADGYLLKNIDHDQLAQAIKQLHAGKSVLDPSVTESVLSAIRGEAPKEKSILAKKEQAIMELVSQGRTNQEIAAQLGMPEKSVRNALSLIYKQVGVTNRTEAAAYWLSMKRS